MRRIWPAAAVLIGTAALVLAKPLTVFTEARPDGFDVVQYNWCVTTNASADVIFSSLVSYAGDSGHVAEILSRVK